MPKRIGLIGCGVVGTAVAAALCTEPHLKQRFTLSGIAVRDLRRRRSPHIPRRILSSDPLGVARSDQVDIVVEVMGGIDLAAKVVEAALLAGKPVVTANKALLAQQGPQLRTLAEELGVPLLCEASVAAAVPVISTILNLRGADEVLTMEGVLNGTSNYVLTRMAQDHASLEQALREAQSLGYAEAVADRDIDGLDAADKLAILAQLAWDLPVTTSHVAIRGIRHLELAAVGDGSCRLVARAVKDGNLTVQPERLAPNHPLRTVNGADNGIIIKARRAGTLFLRAAGAGGDETAAAIMWDLARLSP